MHALHHITTRYQLSPHADFYFWAGIFEFAVRKLSAGNANGWIVLTSLPVAHSEKSVHYEE
jgi:hypothetical protein